MSVCVLSSRRLVDTEDELSDIQSDSVPSEVRDWLASTFTRQMGLMLRRTEEKPRFRSIVHAVQAGIFVERYVVNWYRLSVSQRQQKRMICIKDNWCLLQEKKNMKSLFCGYSYIWLVYVISLGQDVPADVQHGGIKLSAQRDHSTKGIRSSS